MEKSEGNTKPRITQSKYWMFTWNNYDDESVEKLEHTFDLFDIDYVFQEENEGTPHLQGYIECKQKKRWSEFNLPKQIHWEKRRGTRLQAIEYCSRQSKRAEEGEIFVRGLRIPRPLIKMTLDKLWKPWHFEIAALIKNPPDPLFNRTINWYWSDKGNIGKTACAKYIIDNSQAVEVSGGLKDIAFIIKSFIEMNGEGPEVVLWDIPRSYDADHFNYTAVEKVLDGKLFSAKYESASLRFNSPHVIIFANIPPSYERCSDDRWNVEEVE